MSTPVGPVWSALEAAASAFCPPLEVSEAHRSDLRLSLHDPATGEELTLRYRSERGLFLRTYFLVAETQIAGLGPARAGRLVLRHRRLRWKRPKPEDAKRWSKSLSSPELRAALAEIPVERLALVWEPERAAWTVSLETLSGSLTVTFFPPLMTPNPLKRDEARAVVTALRALRRAVTRTPA